MRGTFMLLAGAALAWPLSVAAQETQAGTASQSDEIIVTGEKSGRTLQDTTTSVAVITAERIAQENVQTIQDIYNRTANVGETYGAAGFTIRGINNIGVGAGGNADTSTVYVDGAPIPSVALFGGPTDLWDVGQVEILRGPQSTIQGLNSLAGAVVITTRNPSLTDFGADGRILWTDREDRTFSAAVGGPIIQDELGFRISAERRADRGLIRNVTRGEYDDALRALNLRAKLLWMPAALPGLEVQASYNRVRRDGGYLYEYARTDVPDYFGNRISTGNRPSLGNIQTDIAVLNVGYEIAPQLKFSSVTSFNRVQVHAAIDTDGTAQDIELVDNLSRYRTWTQEIRLNYDGGRLSGVLGAWAYRRTGGLDAANQLNIATPTPTIAALLQQQGATPAEAAQVAGAYANALPVIPVTYDGDQDQFVRNAALFADARFHLTDRLSLIAGFRYDHEENRYASGSIAAFSGTLPNPASFGPLASTIGLINQGVLGLVRQASAPYGGSARSFDAFLPKAGISMDWTPDLTTAFTVQRAYRSGGSSQNPARATLVAYDAEHSWNYEGSLRSRWLDGRLTLNANIFYVDWKNQQTTVFYGLNAYDYNTVNAGKSHLYGFEVEAQGKISQAVDAYVSLGHVRTKFDEFNLPVGATSQLDLAGSEFPYAARWTLAGGVNARLGGFTGNLNANYRGPVFSNVGADQALQSRLDGRTVVNARIGYELDRFSLYAFARNLLDEKYIQYDYAGSNRAILGDPQTFGLGLDFHL